MRSRKRSGLPAPNVSPSCSKRFVTDGRWSRIAHETNIDPWFLEQVAAIDAIAGRLSQELTPELLDEAKRCGFSDRQIASFHGIDEKDVRERRSIYPVFKRVDTCAAEIRVVHRRISTRRTTRRAKPSRPIGTSS